MATKTITLKLDAHERRRTAKKAGESFSEVVRRASFADAPLTGEALRAYLHSGGSGISEHYLAKKLRSSEPFNRADLRAVFPVRLSRDERKSVDAAANAAGEKPTTWARNQLLKAACHDIRTT